jgi:DNA-binding NarL/FixJ family response regulator
MDAGMANNDSLKLYIATDYALVREGIIDILRRDNALEVEGGSFTAPPRLGEETDVVLCVTEPRPDLAQIISCLQTSAPASKVACLLLSENDDAILTVLRSGASCIIDKAGSDSLTPERLIEQVKQIASGEFVLSTNAAVRLARLYALPPVEAHAVIHGPREADLTQREEEVLALLAEGYTNRDIADRLSLSEHTVRAHMRGIMQKLNVSNRVQAAALAWAGRGNPTTGRQGA